MNTVQTSTAGIRVTMDASPTDIPAPPVLLEVANLTRRFAKTDAPAVDNVSFALAEGELLALLGPSGCGKTTTLRMIGGLEQPDSGQVRLHGRDITHLPTEKRGIGIVFQDYALFPHLSVQDNVRFGLRRMVRADADDRVRDMLDMVGLRDLAARRPHELSGGQQQRVALARTLAVSPPLVLLDEPFSNLDAAMRIDTRQEVRALLKRAGSAAILVTHDQEEALAMADRVAVLERGRLLQIATPEEVYLNPASSFVASFIARANILSGTASGMGAATALGTLPLSRAADGAVKLAVRPEQIRLEPDPASPIVVVNREFRGHDQLYWVQNGAQRILVISGPDTAANLPFAVGSRVRLRIVDPVTPVD